MTLRREPIWQLDGSRAELHTERFFGSVDLTRPADGIGNIEVAAGTRATRVPLDARLMQLNVTHQQLDFETLVDSYVRGDDLIANYERTAERSVAPQVYWRYLPSRGGPAEPGGIEIVASMQTGLLDDQPLSVCRNQMAAREVLYLESADPPRFRRLEGRRELEFSPSEGLGAFLFRSSDTDVSFLVMVFPGDFYRAEARLHEARRCEIAFHLFPGHLEKGVIRQGRVRGVFLAAGNDEADAQVAFDAFAASEPPLTA